MARARVRLLRGLRNQLMLSPVEVRRAHARRLEEFLLELEPDRVYPYDFLYFRTTGFRPADDVRDSYPGESILPELIAILGELSWDAPREVADVGEPVHTIEGAARAAGVSVRTIHRWRRRGLICRRYVFAGGEVRVGVRASALERFAAQNPELAGRSRRFSKLSEAERASVLRLARRYAERDGLSLSAAAARIGRRMGRATETIRLLLSEHDLDSPDEAIFGRQLRTPSSDVQSDIYEDYRRGIGADSLAGRYRRSRQTIYRLINAERAERFLRPEMHCFHEDAFDAPDAEERIFGPEVRALLEDSAATRAALGPGTPVRRWWRSPLDARSERALFRAYNYTKHLIAAGCAELNPRSYVSSALLNRLQDLDARALRVREHLLHVHMPLIEHVAWQHAGVRAPDELIAQGRLWLAELIDGFDYRGRSRFTSYTTLELLKRFARSAPPDT